MKAGGKERKMKNRQKGEKKQKKKEKRCEDKKKQDGISKKNEI